MGDKYKKSNKKEIIKQNFEITKIDFEMTNLEKDNLQANVSIYLNNLIRINNIHVFEIEGSKNIIMPYMYDGLFYNFFVNFLDKDIYKLVSDEILKKFDKHCAKFRKKN